MAVKRLLAGGSGFIITGQRMLTMTKLLLALPLAVALALGGCVAPTGPVEVTRFHAADILPLGRGTIAIEPAPGHDGSSLEWKAYQAVVERQLVLLGYSAVPAGGASGQVAQLRFSR